MIHRFVQRDRQGISEERLLEVMRGVVVTEKSTVLTQEQQYTFRVMTCANKFEIKKSIEHLFGVKVAAVNTIHISGKEKRFRGKIGKRPSIKKAIVTLEKGQTIDLTTGVQV